MDIQYLKKRISGLGINLSIFFLVISIIGINLYSSRVTKQATAIENTTNKEESFIIKYKDSNKRSNSLLKTSNSKQSDKWEVISNKDRSKLEELKKDPNVQYIQPNFKRKVSITPDDPYYNSTGSYYPFTHKDQWNLESIDLKPSGLSGWDINTGSSNTIVAVIDTGIDKTHPDLTANLWINTDEVPSNGIDDDGNGYIDDRDGYNFADNNTNVQDIAGHGTHVSGTIAAATNNSLGIAGVCWNCKIMPLKVINAAGFGFDSDIAEAIHYARDNGAKVINISLGGAGYSQILQDAIDYAWNNGNGTLVVTSSGNDYGDASDNYPGGAAHTLTVGAIDYQNLAADFSNNGYRLDVIAPGVNILSTKLQSISDGCVGNLVYYCLSGTSMASPHVAGVAALIFDHHRSDPTPWNASQVRQTILQTTTNLGAAGFDTIYGFGKPNSYAALSAVTPTDDVTLPTGSLNTINGTQQDIIQISGSASDANLYIYTINIIRDSDNYVVKQLSGRSSVTNNILTSFDTNLISDGVYDLTMRVEDFKGNSITTNTVQMTIDNDPPAPFYGLFPIENSWTYQDNIEFVWSNTDHSSVTTYDLYIDGQLRGDNLTTNSAIINGLADGVHSWYLIAVDASNQTTQSSTMSFGVDRVPPGDFSINAVNSGSNVTFAFGATDNLSGISRYDATIDSGTTFDTSSPFTRALSDGNHTITIRAYDNANNYRSSTKTFLVDATPPNEFSITVVVEGSKTTTYFAASDSLSAVTSYAISMDGGIESVVTSPHIIDNIPDGNHSINVKAFDSFGNHRNSSSSFKVDVRTPFLKSKGDFNASGKVDLTDLSILASNWKKTTSNGDANSDNKVDLTDLSILASNWNKTF